jgi:AcrR family transcriptional regulator
MSTPTPPNRAARRKHEVRQRILAAAHQLFEARGYTATTVADICEQADVAYKTLFNHFESKQAVLDEIEAMALAELLAHLDAALHQSGSTRERLKFLFERIALSALSAGPMHRELLTELIHSVHSRGDEPEQVRRVSDGFAAIITRGLEAGDVTTASPPETLTELIQGAYYVLMFSYGNLVGYPLRERAADLAELLGDSVSSH